jgi:LysM repeat protein
MSERDELFGARRPRRSPARFLAPVFLIAVLAGTYVVVHNGVHAITSTSSSSSSTRSRSRRHLTRGQRKYARQRYYVVQSGDSLTLIANKTGIGLGTLELLNPRLNPNALQLGQRIRLRR